MFGIRSRTLFILVLRVLWALGCGRTLEVVDFFSFGMNVLLALSAETPTQREVKAWGLPWKVFLRKRNRKEWENEQHKRFYCIHFRITGSRCFLRSLGHQSSAPGLKAPW